LKKQTKKGYSPVNFLYYLVVRLASVWAHSPVLIGSIPINDLIHMAELVDALDLKSSSLWSWGSIPYVNRKRDLDREVIMLDCKSSAQASRVRIT
jgi:hypothetical protein